MKIVVLDGYGLNPGDLSWEKINELGELVVYDRTSPEEILHGFLPETEYPMAFFQGRVPAHAAQRYRFHLFSLYLAQKQNSRYRLAF